MKARRYTGAVDGAVTARRAGMTAWIDHVIRLSEGALWNNGDYVVRNMRGKDTLSVHATGRAVDLSYRHMVEKRLGIKDGRQAAINVMRTLVKNADLIGLELILDYYPSPFGRGWRCDRRDWVHYDVRTITGAPSGDWIHCEINPKFADDVERVNAAFGAIVQVV